ncbi:class I SAM-dependent methyltransferase [Enterococcus alcedinis]|uniref:class I SAM-dependent methyltransferase n=1 Tax=Enterococcus alcedinis TaxID=1274384 RepID=UPI003620922E
MNRDELNEEQDFWDEFAGEYTAIQSESQVNIVGDISAYLAGEISSPVDTLVDLAGGSGKYLLGLESLTKKYILVDFSKEMIRLAQTSFPMSQADFQLMDQASFLSRTSNQSYDVLFSAMNPAIRTKNDLNEILRITKKRVYLLRLVQEEESLFSPFEEENDELKLMARYKNWLDTPYQSHYFTYRVEEVITKDFFYDYYSDQLAPVVLEQALQQFFPVQDTAINHKLLTFELLSIDLEDCKGGKYENYPITH